jgi:hypothetical protein
MPFVIENQVYLDSIASFPAFREANSEFIALSERDEDCRLRCAEIVDERTKAANPRLHDAELFALHSERKSLSRQLWEADLRVLAARREAESEFHRTH